MIEEAGLLGRIVARTREAIEVRRRELPLHKLLAAAPTPGTRRPFGRAIRCPKGINVIAEFKRRSPSRGVIRDDLHPTAVAQAYEIGGAAALSVLTEEQYFAGSLEDLQQARAATLLPTLRKDFIVDPYQIREAWVAGADAVLLIVAIVSDHELRRLMATARELEMDALVEVHTPEDLDRALAVGAEVIGVNNRDLCTLEVRLETSLELAALIPDGVVTVSESGIRTGEDVSRVRAAGYDAVLVGEHLMSSPDPHRALEKLIHDAADVED
jgi:indole-3-glycerol phosphate synthase